MRPPLPPPPPPPPPPPSSVPPPPPPPVPCLLHEVEEKNMGITTMAFAAPSDDYVPLYERLILTSAWSTERSGRILAGVVEDSISLKEAINGVDSVMYTRAIW